MRIKDSGAVLAIFVHEVGDDSLECIGVLRQRYPWLGVLALCMPNDITERLAAYVAGADVCLALPIAEAELCAVTATLIRRLGIPERNEQQDAARQALFLNVERGELCYQGKTLPLASSRVGFFTSLGARARKFSIQRANSGNTRSS